MHADNHSSRRRFLRHRAEIPVEISTQDQSWSRQVNSTHDISNGGLSFNSEMPFEVNQIIELVIRITSPYFEENARVIWCRANSDGYEIGVQFLNNEARYGIRMVEQVCHIEQYRKDIKAQQGRELSTQEAAIEWISKYAAEYRQHS